MEKSGILTKVPELGSDRVRVESRQSDNGPEPTISHHIIFIEISHTEGMEGFVLFLAEELNNARLGCGFTFFCFSL